MSSSTSRRLAGLTGLLLVLACSPSAGDESAETEAGSTSGDGDGDPTGDGDGDPTGDGDGDATGDGDGDPTGGTCDLAGGVPLAIELPVPCAGDDPMTYDGFFAVSEVTNDALMVTPCLAGDCAECANQIPAALTVSPLPLAGLTGPDACIHVSATRVDPNNPDVCTYQTIVISEVGNGAETMLLAARGSNEVELLVDVGFEPALMVEEECSCDAFPDSCCNDVTSPKLYVFDVGLGDPVSVGTTADVTIDAGAFEFWALDAFASGECDDPLHLAWGLVRQ